MKRLWLVAVTLAATSVAHAQVSPYYYPGAYPGPGMHPGMAAPRPMAPLPDFAATAPDQILRSGLDRLQGFLARGGTADADEVSAFLDHEISPFFDFAYMARWAGGPFYAQMSEEQRTQFADKIKTLFFAALARNLGAYSDPAPLVEVSHARPRGYGREVDVTARVIPQGQGAVPVRLDFRFYPSRSGWKIFDVTANGTSAVAYYRSYFREVARRGSIEACCR